MRITLTVLSCLLALIPASVHGQQPAPESPAAEDGKWDVNDPPGPRTTVEIDTREGTWMSLDVSPDGRQIVFDLLGDLYTVPIGGGDATALTSGLAWDMQPRFSPDGARIAFTSDRGGGDNIWIVTRDGSEPRPVSKESFRLLNSPAWSPDGRFIAARKHFTSTRSLGAGEIWLYHVSGGDGLQMTKRPNDQKDVGEPAFSPDGRYLYFSRDLTPGAVFEYSKDVHGQIYVIRRLDRETGEILSLVTGPGGAARPTPSPDGRHLAFVRRDGLKTSIFLRELASGAEWPVYDGLDRDMQETWAIHGVYPAMAWTPDSAAIVFWAGGGLHRVEASSKQVTPIPFRVRDTRELTEVVRFPVEVAPPRFDVRMLRWVRVSPAGDRVVYQALGRLYVRDLPDGQPRRLTAQQNHFELYPSFSRDGREIAYVSWDDERQGAVRVVSAEGGEGRVVTSARGAYIEPVFSPDGSTIVFQKIATGGLLSPLFATEPGVYRIADSGDGEPQLVTPSGVRPRFGSRSDRVFLTRFADGKRRLVSVDLNGSHEEVLVESENATEFAVSPDEKWLAFTERFNAYITPFTRTGRTIPLSPSTRAVPVKQVSRDAGEYLHWSGDSRQLHWALGAELFSRDLADSFDFVAGAPDEIPGPSEAGLPIGFQAESDVPAGSIALVGGRIITMRGDEVIEDGTIVVDRNRIVAVGPRSEVEVPADAHRVDVAGQTILPGLIDVHHHGGQGQAEIVPEQNWSLFSTLSFGVTTVHDPSNDTSTIFAAAEMARAGLITAPRIYSTGTILYGAAGDFKAEINSLEDARSHLRRMKAAGAFSVKSYNQPRRDQRQQVIAAARELEMMVVPEGGSLFEHNLTMIADGHTGIEHSIPVPAVYDDTLQFWGASRTWYTPTLVVGYGGLWGEHYWYQHTNVWENERLTTFVPRRLIEARSRRRPMAADDDYNHFNNARIAKQLIDVGVHVQLGAHGQREGLAPHWELWMFEQGGMTELEALRCATLNGARYLGLDKDLGSLEAGKLADLIVLEANPLDDIRNSEKIRYTMVNGRMYDSRTLNQMGNHPRERRPFYFENEGPPSP